MLHRGGVRPAQPVGIIGANALPGVLDTIAAITTLQRAADASEIASAVVFLASPEASYVNGAILHATGGQRAIAA